MLGSRLRWSLLPEIACEQTMEEMLAGFAAHRQTAGSIRARLEPALYRLTDRYVFLLNLLADRDAFEVSGTRCLRGICEVEVEDHFGPIHTSRDNQVGIHRLAVTVDHEVRIDPVVVRPRALPHSFRSIVGSVADNRTRLQAVPLPVGDGVLAVIEHAVEPFVQMRHVIATIEVVVHEHLPVAVERVAAPLHPPEAFETELLELIHDIRSKELLERQSSRLGFDKCPCGAHVAIER